MVLYGFIWLRASIWEMFPTVLRCKTNDLTTNAPGAMFRDYPTAMEPGGRKTLEMLEKVMLLPLANKPFGSFWVIKNIESCSSTLVQQRARLCT